MTWTKWFLNGLATMLSRWLVTHKIGREGSNYLTRWELVGRRFKDSGSNKLYLHRFQASDPEEYHDHPWPFWSLIIGPGYWEKTPDGRRVWYGPFTLLRRSATCFHSVEIPTGSECWSIVWTGPKIKSWGFLCPGLGWVPWRTYLGNVETLGRGCGD